tara:strand:+ start:1835 stop:2773 length:939 start_codon:yes stop_codon:yes gene_type:complete
VKISPLSILFNNNLKVDKKFYFISGNEKSLMEKVKSKIIEKFSENEKILIRNIGSIVDFVDEGGLFQDKNIFIVNNIKGVNKEIFNDMKSSENYFIFVQENSQKIKKVKNLFNADKDSYLIDCYELDKNSKIKILNEYLMINTLKISQEVYWLLVDKLDNRYVFFENSLVKILELEEKNITISNVKKILIIDESGKEKIFFNLFKKNKEIVEIYREKIITNSDVNDFYYSSKYFCQLIIDCNSEDEYNKKIPVYLFREKNYLIDIFRKYNSNKKKLLLQLLSSTEKILRKESSLSLVAGLRFLLNIKKITIS